MKTRLGVLLMALFATLFGCASIPRGLGPLTVVPTVDPQRYIGRWYEIARFQHGFEQDIVGATAEYSLNKNGTIAVVNSGFKNTLAGEYSEVKAVARMPDPTKPSRLKVKFFGLFEADYLIFGLDDALFARMKSIAVAQGYVLDGLYKVPQKAR